MLNIELYVRFCFFIDCVLHSVKFRIDPFQVQSSNIRIGCLAAEAGIFKWNSLRYDHVEIEPIEEHPPWFDRRDQNFEA